MYRSVHAALCIAPIVLASCTSMYFVHDPQTGVITANQLPNFIKSVRCELITFYTIQRSRRHAFETEYPKDPEAAIAKFSYFNLDPNLFSTFTLDLKVVDSGGVGSGTMGDIKHVLNATESTTWHLSPTASAQGTYNLIWSFLIRQDASLKPLQELSYAPTNHRRNSDRFECYRGEIPDLESLEAIAANPAADQALFTRVLVNAYKPLSAWLRDNATMLSRSFLTTSAEQITEAAAPAQMYYGFAIQVQGGAEGRYTLMSPHWSPLSVQLTATMQQNTNLQIYINGVGAQTAAGAKTGSAAIVPPLPLGHERRPMHVVVDSTKKGLELKEDRLQKILPPPPAQRRPAPFNLDRGYLTAPVPLNPPTPSQ